MAEKTGIEWTDSTWNPVRGTEGNWHCTKVSPGCVNCYAERYNMQRGGPAYVAGADQLRVDTEALRQPLRWQRGRKIFVCSMTDLFHEDLPFEQIDRIFAVMILARHHTFQVLTKRVERMYEYLLDEEREKLLGVALGNMLDGAWIHTKPGKRWRPYIETEISRALGQWDLDEDLNFEVRPDDHTRPTLPAPNIGLGATIENQEALDYRAPILREIPAAWRFFSMEPLLGAVTVPLVEPTGRFRTRGDRRQMEMRKTGIDWVIAGGESGANARPSHPDWFRSLRDQCAQAGVPYMFKQWGEWCPETVANSRKTARTALYIDVDGSTRPAATGARGDSVTIQRVGKAKAGKLLDGREHLEFPK